MPVSRDEVVHCYRHLLGRVPENDDVIEDKIRHHNSFWELVDDFIVSVEYRSKLAREGRAAEIADAKLRTWDDVADDLWAELAGYAEGSCGPRTGDA